MSVTKTPSRPPRHGFPVVVHVLARRGAAVVLLRRAGTGFADGMWSLPGGHLEAGEAAREGAVRELREETGIDAPAAALAPLGLRQYASPAGGGFNLLFELGAFEGDPVVAEPHASDAVGVFAAAAPPAPLVPWVADVLARPRGWYVERGFD